MGLGCSAMKWRDLTSESRAEVLYQIRWWAQLLIPSEAKRAWFEAAAEALRMAAK